MDVVHLVGAEEVSGAASRIRSAADDMRSAAATIDEALHRHALTGDERVQRIEHAAQMNVRAALAGVAVAGMQAANAQTPAGRNPMYTEYDFLQIAEKLAKECGL